MEYIKYCWQKKNVRARSPTLANFYIIQRSVAGSFLNDYIGYIIWCSTLCNSKR
jgi:hypothetical protein